MEELRQEQEGASGSGDGDDADDAGDAGDGGDASAAPQQQQSAGGGGGGGSAGADGDGSAGADGGGRSLRELADLDFDAGQLEPGEQRLLAASAALIGACGAVLRAVGRALLAGPPLGAADVEGWESMLYHARALRRCVEDLGAAMYPPQARARMWAPGWAR